MFERNYIKSRFTFDKRRNYIWSNIERYIERIIPKTDSILEMGAGYCDWINNCDASHRVAYDINSDFKDFAKPEVKFIQGTCTELQPKFINKFERIQLSNLIEHLFYEEINKTIDNLKMYLNHGGFIVIIQPNYFYSYRSYFDDFTHRTIWTHVSLKDLFESKGFTSVHIEKKFLPFSIKSKLSWGYKLIKYYLRSPYKPLGGQMLLIFRLKSDLKN